MVDVGDVRRRDRGVEEVVEEEGNVGGSGEGRRTD